MGIVVISVEIGEEIELSRPLVSKVKPSARLTKLVCKMTGTWEVPVIWLQNCLVKDAQGMRIVLLILIPLVTFCR